MSSIFKIFFIICVTYFIEFSHGFERDLTINVDPGKSDCFYQQAIKGHTIDIEYQVIDGTRGSLDVGFVLLGPDNRVLVALPRRQSGMARAEATVTGDYRFCFDNTHSTISSKTIFFDLLIDDENDNSEEDVKNTDADDDDVSHDIFGEDLNDVANRVAIQLAKARRLQEAAAARSARDDHAAARSHLRVTICSASNALAIFTIGLLQVVLIRSFFDEKSRIRGLWTWDKIPFLRS